MPHQITTRNILHAEVNAGLCLECGVKVEQERMSGSSCCQEDALLGFGAARDTSALVKSGDMGE